MAEPAGSDRQVSWREVVLVAAAVAAIGLGLGLLSTLVPPIGAIFDRFPVAILALAIGTAWVLRHITHRGAPF